MDLSTYFLIFGLFQHYNAELITVSLPKLSQSKLVGSYNDTSNTTTFLGVRYVSSPDRWEKATPLKPWIGERESTKFGKSCIQVEHFTTPPKDEQSEDCLFLNIYVPGKLDPQGSKKLPVMVWIHGGALVTGTAKSYNGNHFAQKSQVIVVTINYRLNVFGFYFAEDLGNLGFVDQRMALEWVQTHIDTFGGDPNRVVIFGESAGGISVSAQIFSAKAKGLFYGAISQSGVLGTMERAKEKRYDGAFKFANSSGCPQESVSDALKCLRRKSADVLRQQYAEIFMTANPIGFGVDPESLDEPTEELLKKKRFNDVPYIIGMNNMEGNVYTMMEQKPKVYEWMITYSKRKFLRNRQDTFNHWLTTTEEFPVEAERKRAVHALIKEYSMDDTDENKVILFRYFQAMGDMVFERHAYKEANELAKIGAKVYVYKLISGHPGIGNKLWEMGAGHGDDLVYLWNLVLPGLGKKSAKQEKLADVWVQSWANFARSGKVDAIWKPWKQAEQKYLELQADLVEPLVPKEYSRLKFMTIWEKDLKKIAKNSSIPLDPIIYDPKNQGNNCADFSMLIIPIAFIINSILNY